MESAMIRPLLAVTAQPEQIQFPCFVSPKMDGIRAIGYKGALYARSGELIPNKFIQSFATIFQHMDGEITCGNIQQTTSAVMSLKSEPDFTFSRF